MHQQRHQWKTSAFPHLKPTRNQSRIFFLSVESNENKGTGCKLNYTKRILKMATVVVQRSWQMEILWSDNHSISRKISCHMSIGQPLSSEKDIFLKSNSFTHITRLNITLISCHEFDQSSTNKILRTPCLTSFISFTCILYGSTWSNENEIKSWK